jgi:hypothetical protein
MENLAALWNNCLEVPRAPSVSRRDAAKVFPAITPDPPNPHYKNITKRISILLSRPSLG